MKAENSATGRKGRSAYTEDFKRAVVDQWCHGKQTAQQVATEFGVSVWNVRDWRGKYGPTHKPIDAPIPDKPEERELQQLRKELARVTTQRDILKKLPCLLAEAPREMKITSQSVDPRADAKAA